MARWLDAECPGITIPAELMQRLVDAKTKGVKQGIIEANVDFFGDLIEALTATRAAGCHIMVVGFEWIVPQIIERAGLALTVDWRRRMEGSHLAAAVPQGSE